jgi:hypothetical protein
MNRYLGVLAGVLLVLLSGCDRIHGLDDFQISVSNRTVNTLLIYVNGMEQGQVGAGRAEAFVVKVKKINSNYTYTEPSSTALLTVVARDLVTMRLSREKQFYTSDDRSKNVEFNPTDFQ